ncbi:hypothetical protein C8R43DRAFT_955754 [Mycena crocata]|nr:hypothetical protein C8R43DRAFT_955754 [Mycena crocata]
MRDLANLVEGYVEAPALAGVFCNADEEAGRAVPGLFWNEVMVAVPTSAPPCKSLLNALLHRGTRFADPGRYRAYDAWLRMDPLARDGERGWGGSWLPAFDWRARAGRGFNSAGARSSRFLTNLTTRAGWRARGFLLRRLSRTGKAMHGHGSAAGSWSSNLMQLRVAQRSDPESQCEGNRENILRQTQGTAPKMFFVSPAASTLLFARISAHREGPGPAAGRMRSFYRYKNSSSKCAIHASTAKAFASIYIRSNYLPNDQTHYGQVFVTVRSGGTNDASLSLQPVDQNVPTTSCTISHVDKVAITIDKENNSWEGVVERASIGLFRLHLVFASPSNLDAFLFAVRFASHSATFSLLSRLLHGFPTRQTIMAAFRPMDTLPVELLAEIFMHYRRLISRRGVDQVLLLGSVCLRWRDVAWYLKALWSKPHFELGPAFFLQDMGDHMVDPRTQQMLAWLRRATGSMVAQLTVRITVDLNYSMVPVLGRFLPTVSSSVRVLRLELSQPQLAPLFGDDAPVFPHLESLSLRVAFPDHDFHWPWAKGLTTTAPQLRSLVLRNLRTHVTPFPTSPELALTTAFPWAQLTNVDLAFGLTSSNWLGIFYQCTTLRTARFVVGRGGEPPAPSREPVIFKDLVSLDLSLSKINTNIANSDIFDRVQFPALQLLLFRCGVVPRIFGSGQCSQLRFLRLSERISNTSLLGILRSHPNLERLEVQLLERNCFVIWAVREEGYLKKLQKLAVGFQHTPPTVAVGYANQAIAAGWEFTLLGCPSFIQLVHQALPAGLSSFRAKASWGPQLANMSDGSGGTWGRSRWGITIQTLT